MLKATGDRRLCLVDGLEDPDLPEILLDGGNEPVEDSVILVIRQQNSCDKGYEEDQDDEFDDGFHVYPS